MSPRHIAFAFAPTQADEAKGVLIRRSIGGDRMALLDPYLLLDHVTVDLSQGSDEIGFPRHPHRGIETLSYVIKGHVAHRDSLGNEGRVGAGGAQWMTAGNGIYHEEMLAPDSDGGEFIQLWFSPPKALKRTPAGYVGAPGDSIPVVDTVGATVRIVAGSFAGIDGAFGEIATQPTVIDAMLVPETTLDLPAAPGENAFLYVLDGSILVGDKGVSLAHMAVLTDGDGVRVESGPAGARVLFVSAKPLDEPVLQYRSFVMNSPNDIRETLDMIADGTFGQLG